MSLFSTPCQIQCYLVYVILLFTDPISYSYALFRKCEMWWKDYLMHKKETHNKETCSFMEVNTFIRFLFTTDMFWLWLQLLKHYSIKWMCSTAKNHCVTRAPLLYFVRSWVALSFKVCQWVRHVWHPSRSPLCAIYKGINALYWPSITNYQLPPPHSVL